jgi:hypothetical protein
LSRAFRRRRLISHITKTVRHIDTKTERDTDKPISPCDSSLLATTAIASLERTSIIPAVFEAIVEVVEVICLFEVVEVICLFEVVEVACLFEVVICLFEVLEVVCRFEVVEVTCISVVDTVVEISVDLRFAVGVGEL